jgi:hypothetical protein
MIHFVLTFPSLTVRLNEAVSNKLLTRIQIVEEDSAKMADPAEHYYPMPGCDRMSICKFSGEDSPSYKLVWGVLREWAEAERTGQ